MLFPNQTSAGLRSLKILFWCLVVVLYFSGPAYSQSRFIRNWANLEISHLNAPLLMSPLPDSGWVVVSMPNSKEEVLLTRYRNCGDILWEKSFHDPDILHPASISFSDEKNNILLTFQTENSNLQKGIYLLVIGLTGTQELSFHLLGNQDLNVKSADFLENGNYFIGGVEGVGASLPFLMVFNENGDLLWSKKKQSVVASEMSAIPVSDGGILSCGGNTITKWNSQGAVEFQATVTASFGQFDLGTSTPLEYDEGFIVATAFFNTNSCNLLKINKSGIHEWFSPSIPIIVGGTFSQLHKLRPSRICADVDNNIVIAGSVNIDASTLGTRIYKFSPLGIPLYTNTFSFSENLYSYDFGILKSGEGLILNIHQNRNPILLKTNPKLEIGCHEAPTDHPISNVGPIIQTIPAPLPSLADLPIQKEVRQPNLTDLHPHEEHDLCFFFDNPPQDITIDTFICLGATIDIEASHPYPSIQWQNGSTNNLLTVTEPGTYYADFSYCGIKQRINFNVPDGNCPCTVEVPNVFSPNNDGVNDLFAPVYQCVFVGYDLSIFNRWGEKIYSTQSHLDGWDGKCRGVDCPSDVYIWSLKYTGYHEGQVFYRKTAGDVTLLR